MICESNELRKFNTTQIIFNIKFPITVHVLNILASQPCEVLEMTALM